MPKDKNKLLQYIDHGQELKKKYQKANLNGQHNQRIRQLEKDIALARQALRA